MKFIDSFIKYRVVFLALIASYISILFVGCSHFQDELSPSKIDYAKDYKEDIVSKRCANGDVYYEYRVRLIGFCEKPHKFGYQGNADSEHYDTLVYEEPSKTGIKLLNILKDKGLYLNDYKYIYNKCGDIYIVMWGSPKPSVKKDWKELDRHNEIVKFKKLKKQFPSITNDVPKCECRYCTSGLDKKYWY